MIAIAPCFRYLVAMIADSDIQLGLFKNRILTLANKLKNPMERVTPRSFLEE